jgi:hypothetical protein
MGAQDHGRCVVPVLWVAVGRGQQFAMVVSEPDPRPAERDQPIGRRGAGAKGWRPEQERLLNGLFVLVQQHHHQAGPAAEAAEQRAFADSGGGGDVVGGDGVGAALGDQVSGSLEEQGAVARRVAPFLVHHLGGEHVQLARPLAHSCTLTLPE